MVNQQLLDDVRTFAKLRDSDPRLHDYARKALVLERNDLVIRLEVLDGERAEERDEIKRSLWVINGVLDEGLDSELLHRCAEKHRARGTVPCYYSVENLF